jgi:hypothetical protein
MELLKGILFAIGCIIGAFIVLIILIIIYKVTRKKEYAKAKVWREYLKDLISQGHYEEANFITTLLVGLSDEEKVQTPKNYKIEIKPQIIVDDENEVKKVIMNKVYKIKKIDDGK